MTFQSTESPHQLPGGVLYCGDLECAYCKERRAERFRNPAQLLLVPRSTYAISRTRDLTLVDLICYTYISVVVLGLLAVIACAIYLSWK